MKNSTTARWATIARPNLRGRAGCCGAPTDERGERQGVHVSFPSSCLDNLLAHGYNSTRLLNTVDLFEAKVTRIDIAYDDRPQVGQAGLLDFVTILEAIRADEFVSRPRQVRLMEFLKGGKGTTIYFGSGQSDTLLRIYDKAAEQQLDNEHWIRVEIQLRRERAHALFLLLANEYCVEDFDIGAVLLAVLDFKTPTDDTTKAAGLLCRGGLSSCNQFHEFA